MHICSPNDVNHLIFIFLTNSQESHGCHAVDEANVFWGGRNRSGVVMSMFFPFTLPKTNIAPENGALEKEIPFGNHPFQVPC